jgi:hypothetical protein
MDVLWIALGKVGGFAAVGAAIDFLLRKGEKERLNDWLIRWWVRFEDVKWTNFGRKDAEFAIGILDRYAGARLWSWKRWRFTLSVGAFAAIVSLVWSAYGLYLIASVKVNGTAIGLPPDMLKQVLSSFNYEGFILMTMGFALSISVTRLISTAAARRSDGKLETALTFSVVLALHLFLFVVWTNFVLAALYDFLEFLSRLRHQDPSSALGGAWAGTTVSILGHFVRDPLGSVTPYRVFSDARAIVSVAADPTLSEDVRRTIISVFSYTAAREMFAHILDWLSFGLRITIALVVLGSLMIGTIIKPLISRAWEGAIESRKPLFTLLFTVLGAVVALAT